jgi:hypothetical protein
MDYSNDEGKKHIAYVFHTNENYSKLFKNIFATKN